MPLSQEHVGRTYGPSDPYTVSAESLSAFAGLLGFSNPEVAQGLAAAPTYAITQTFTGILALVEDPDIRLNLSHVVHSDQKFDHARPLAPGDVVSTTTTIEAISPIAGNNLVTLRSDVIEQSGAVLCTARAAILVRAVDEVPQ